MKLFAFVLLGVVLCSEHVLAQRISYKPVSSDEAHLFTINNRSVAGIIDDSTFLVLALDEIELGSDSFFRLWVLFVNNSQQFLKVNASRLARMEVHEPRYGMQERLSPSDPQAMWRRVLNTEAVQEIKNRWMMPNDTTFNEPRSKRSRDSVTPELIPTLWYQEFKWSIHAGIMTEFDLAPGQSINGYIYFPFPSNEIIRSNIGDREDGKYVISFGNRLTKQIEFRPTEE